MANVHHTKHRPLTPEEITQAKDGVVEHMQIVDTLEAELAAEKKEYAKKIRPHKAVIKDLMQKITTGHESGSAWCRVVVDPVTQTVKFFTYKSVFNEETLRDENVETLFDEKTFEEVGEKQLAMWQEETEGDVIADAIERVDQDEFDSFEKALEDRDITSYSAYEVCEVLARPFPTVAADLFLKYTGDPSTKVNVAFSTQGLRAAASELIEITTECDDSMSYDRLVNMGTILFPQADDGNMILAALIDWSAQEVDDDESNEDED